MAQPTTLKVIPKLADLLVEPGIVSGLPPEAIPTLRGKLAELDTLLLARLLCGVNAQSGSAADGDRLLDVKEAAAKLGISAHAVYRGAAGFPFTVRIGHRLRFSSQKIETYIRQRAGR